MPLQLTRTIFNTEISGVTYRFAEQTMREIENLVKAETEAFDSRDFDKAKDIHFEFVLRALNFAAPETDQLTADDIKDNMGAATFNSLYAAILGAQGIKLEAKNLGESRPSQIS